MRADLVLIKGEPWKVISDVRKIDRVFLDGRLVFGTGAPPMVANVAKTLTSVKLTTALVDDFERQDGRTQLDTLRTDEFDGGMDRSVEVSQVFARPDGGNGLSVTARMSVKSAPVAGVTLPLSRGAIQPMDIRHFTGIQIDVRGQDAYSVEFDGTGGSWNQAISANEQWRTIKVPFAALKGSSAWTGDDITVLQITATRPAGQKVWFELDNVTFY
jgi:hypothetical protein